MELWGKPFHGMMGEQWIGSLSVRIADEEVVLVEIKRDIALYGTMNHQPGAFATIDLILPLIDSKPFHLIPTPCLWEHSSGTLVSCGQARYAGRRDSRAPPREGVVVLGRFAHVLISSSSAVEFYGHSPLAAMHAHLDIYFPHMRNESSFTGLLAEVWGLQPLSQATALLVSPGK